MAAQTGAVDVSDQSGFHLYCKCHCKWWTVYLYRFSITPDVTVTWNGAQLVPDTDRLPMRITPMWVQRRLLSPAPATCSGTANQTFTIGKATPQPTTPSGLTAVYGSTLKDISLPSGIRLWDAPDTSVGDVGEKRFAATYTQDNSGNYNTVQQNLTVKVTPASYKLTLTGQADSPIPGYLERSCGRTR